MARRFCNGQSGGPPAQYPTKRQLASEVEALKQTVADKERQATELQSDVRDLASILEGEYTRVQELKRENLKLDAEGDTLLEEFHKVDDLYHSLVDKHKEAQMQIQQLQRENAALQERKRDFARLHKQDQEAIEGLKEQLINCKSTISTSTRLREQTSDDVIERKANDIFFSVQNFVVRNFRGVRIGEQSVQHTRPNQTDVPNDHDLLPADVKSCMQTYMPFAKEDLESKRVKIIVGIIAMALTPRFKASSSFGVSDDKFINAAAKLARLEPSDHINTKGWLEMTRQLLAQRDAAALEQADKRMLYSIIREILSNLQDALPVVFTVRMQEDLGKVVRSSMELAQLLHHQAAKFRVGMIRARSTDGRPTPFDSNQMEDVSGAMEGGDQGWEVQMTVFPGVFKWGDERGENAGVMRVVSRAKVVAKKSEDTEHGKASAPILVAD